MNFFPEDWEEESAEDELSPATLALIEKLSVSVPATPDFGEELDAA